uniref:Switching B cell complex subunit SWAP70 n=1 Tax=Neogobius melanostomus TaxID=47308 RepID=A0A8C6SYI5_9GOBI
MPCRKNWTEHWFVLRPSYLEYYTSEDLMEIKGIVALGGNCTVESLPDKDRICALLIKSSDTSFEMSGSDKTKKKEWLQAIQKCIQIQKLGLLPPQRQAREKRRQQRELQKVTEDQVTELMRQLQANNESKQRELEALKKMHLEMEEQVAQKSFELQHFLHRVKDLEKVLEDERWARDEQDMRKSLIRLLEERALQRAEVKQMQLQQQRALSQSQAHRKILETQLRDMERQLQEAMQQLEKLKGQNHGADQQNQDVSQRLKRAVIKNLKNKVAIHGLMRLIQPGQKGPLMITNWGPAAFTEAELELRKKFWQESINWSATAE